MKINTPQIQYLTATSGSGVEHQILGGREYVDINVSSKEIKGKKREKISPLRTLQGIDLKLWPGGASGKIIIGKQKFNATHAWTHSEKTDFTLRLEGRNIIKRFLKIINQIILDEYGSLTYFKSFRWVEAKKGNKSVEKYRLNLEKDKKNIEEIVSRPLPIERDGERELSSHEKKMANYFKKVLKEYNKKGYIDELVKQFEKNFKENKPIEIIYHMKDFHR